MKELMLTVYLDLQNSLEDFYSKHAIKQDLDKWLADHQYANATAPEHENSWMAM